MKIRFGLITFYQCFESCQKGFALLHSIQDSAERNDLLIQMFRSVHLLREINKGIVEN